MFNGPFVYGFFIHIARFCVESTPNVKQPSRAVERWIRVDPRLTSARQRFGVEPPVPANRLGSAAGMLARRDGETQSIKAHCSNPKAMLMVFVAPRSCTT